VVNKKHASHHRVLKVSKLGGTSRVRFLGRQIGAVVASRRNPDRWWRWVNGTGASHNASCALVDLKA